MMSSTAGARVGPVSSSKGTKVAERLQKRIEEGEYYEALQTYKALYQRYRAQNREKEALDLIYDGAATLLQHEQWECGNDLAIMLATHYKEKQIPISDESLSRISHLFSLYHPSPPCEGGADSIHFRLQDMVLMNPRELFMRAALKWSHMVGDAEKCKYGHPALHKLLAVQYQIEKQYPLATDHFLYADEPEEFAEMLVEFATTYGLPRERDLFITRAVLQLLVLKKPIPALRTFQHYIRKHPDLSSKGGSQPFWGEPTLNFDVFLLFGTSHSQTFSAEGFNWVKRNYKQVIDMDPCFPEYVDKIGALFFGITPATDTEGEGAGPGGLMGLLGGAGGGGLFDTLLGSLSNSLPPSLPEGTSSMGEMVGTKELSKTRHLQPVAQLDDDDVLD